MKFQNKSLLTSYNLDCLFPRLHSLSSKTTKISSLSTFTINSSKVLETFKSAFQINTKWGDAMAKSDKLFSFSNNLVFHDNYLYVPSSLWSEILHSHHDSVLAGHPGHSITYNLVKQDYSWPGMWTYIRQYVSSCEHCAKIKNITHKPYGLLQLSKYQTVLGNKLPLIL